MDLSSVIIKSLDTTVINKKIYDNSIISCSDQSKLRKTFNTFEKNKHDFEHDATLSNMYLKKIIKSTSLNKISNEFIINKTETNNEFSIEIKIENQLAKYYCYVQMFKFNSLECGYVHYYNNYYHYNCLIFIDNDNYNYLVIGTKGNMPFMYTNRFIYRNSNIKIKLNNVANETADNYIELGTNLCETLCG